MGSVEYQSDLSWHLFQVIQMSCHRAVSYDILMCKASIIGSQWTENVVVVHCKASDDPVNKNVLYQVFLVT